VSDNPWAENLFRPLLVGAMAGCIALSVVELAQLVYPDWNGTYLTVACVLAALEANYSHRLVRARRLSGPDLFRFRVAEIVLFFLLLKIFSYADGSWADVLADVRTWPQQPLAIFDAETLAALVLALFSWLAATLTAQDMGLIGEPPGRDREYVPPSQRLSARFLWGGLAIVVLAGLTRTGIAKLLDQDRPSVPGLVLNVLVYFLLGLVMLGQVRLASLQASWRSQGVQVAKRLPRRWVRYSLIFIGLTALLAFLLPTGYTVGLFEVIGTVFLVLSYLVSLLYALILAPIGWLLYKLSGPGVESPPPLPTPPPLEPPAQGGGSSAAPAWLGMARSLVFWAALLGMVFYVLRTYLRDRPELAGVLRRIGLVHALRRLWAALWHRLTGLAQAVNERVPRLVIRLPRRRRVKGHSRFFRLSALSPRERILYYYLSVLRRAGRQGFPRRRGQTPYEYDADLAPSLPLARREMGALTQAFVEARYSRHSFGRERARRVRAEWQQVKKALRLMKRRVGSTEKEKGTT